MGIVVWYIAVVLVGYMIGGFIKKKGVSKIKWLSPVQTACIIVLLVIMGVRLGSNPDVIAGLGTIGLVGVVTSIFAIAGSVSLVFLARKLMKINRKGEREVE